MGRVLHQKRYRLAVAFHSDFPIDPYGSVLAGDRAYEPILAMTSSETETINAINSRTIRNGLDMPGSQAEALYQAATGEGMFDPYYVPAFDLG